MATRAFVTKPLVASVLTSGVATAAPPAARLDQPTHQAPARAWTSVEQAENGRRCRDRIEQVRAAAGKPKLETAPADPAKPLLMHAVDQRIDGCGVLVPVADPSDVRSPPPPGNLERVPAG